MRNLKLRVICPHIEITHKSDKMLARVGLFRSPWDAARHRCSRFTDFKGSRYPAFVEEDYNSSYSLTAA